VPLADRLGDDSFGEVSPLRFSGSDPFEDIVGARSKLLSCQPFELTHKSHLLAILGEAPHVLGERPVLELDVLSRSSGEPRAVSSKVPHF
jgi:hypothetical protein